MIRTRTGPVVAALALATATTVAVAPAHAAPAHTNPAPAAAAAESAGVQYLAQAAGSADGGSLENPIVQAGLLIVAGIGVSAALAISAGIAGGAIQLPPVPGLPL